MDDGERLLRLPEVGELLGLSVWMVRRLIRRQELDAVNVSTGPGRPTWRVERRAVRAYVASRRSA
ncbi:MAG: helix-turn-helix domain-containing protein [Quadrisphaera sp.]